MKRLILALLVLILLPLSVQAETSAQFQMVGRAPDDPDVNGFRLVLLYGKNKSVRGLDLGLANFSEQETFNGFSFIMGISRTSVSSSGCACSFVNIHEGKSSGFNGAFVNLVKNMETGANVGFVNVTENSSSVDIGGLSMSKKSKTQIGFVNFTEELGTLQIGFLNFAENGFQPMFPFFNYPKKN